jgi:hypothetical protein
MNIQEWERKIKSAKFHVETAKNDFQKQVARHDLYKLNAEFVKARHEWEQARKAETDKINTALNGLDNDLFDLKKLAQII